MRHLSLPIGVLAVSCGLLANAAPARATSSQTWVSATGADSGACAAAAPCRTFLFAYTLTSAGGAINVASAGDFGPVVIGKSISIVADGVEGAIYSAGNFGAGIIVNAANIDVSLRGLTIDMFGTNAFGIKFMSGAALHVQNCTFRGTLNAIRVMPNSGASEIYVTDSVITNTVAEGLVVTPSNGASIKVMLDRVRVQNAGGFGIFFNGNNGPINATVSNSVSAGNAGGGIFAAGVAASPLNVMIDRSVAMNNGNFGIKAKSATIRIGDSTVSGNNTGLSISNGGTIASYGTNKVNGNFPGGDGTPNAAVAYK